MKASTPASGSIEAAARSVRRASVCARVSGISLVALGGVSLLFAITNPVSAGFLISAAVVVNGVIEWRAARRLASLDLSAPRLLAINQFLLGLEIAAYSAWQVFAIDRAALEALLAGPTLKPFLQLFDPAMLDLLMTLLPDMVRLLYIGVGVAALLGCVATAWYYRGRRRSVTVLLSAPPPLR